MSEDNPKPAILDYAKPDGDHRPSFALAAFLWLPGLLCWFMFCFSDLLARYDVPCGDVFPIILWIIAILTAIASFIWYGIRWRKPKPWYVSLCLVANAIGLAFSLLILLFSF